MKWNKLAAILMILATSAPMVALAGDGGKCKVTSDHYFERAGWRLVHGAVNLVASPAELIVEPIRSVRDENQNVLIGIGEGVVKTLKFAALGVWDLGTFWVPSDAGKDIAVTECVIKDLKRADCGTK